MAMNPGPVTPSRSSRCSGASPNLVTTLGALVRRFQQVGLDVEVELPREHHDLGPAVVADRVRRMRSEREAKTRFALPCVACGQPDAQAIIGVGGVRRRKIEHRQSEHGAHPAGVIRPRGGVGKEIHVVTARDAAAKHFGRGKQGSVVDEFRIEEACFARPNVFLEPRLQCDVVSNASQQRHGAVRVRIDQAWH